MLGGLRSARQVVRFGSRRGMWTRGPAWQIGANLRAIPIYAPAARFASAAGLPYPYLTNDMVKGYFSNSRLAL